MRLADLTVAGREPACPALVELSGEASLHVDSWLRILPGQRYVGRARWNGRQVLAKLMVGGKAQRHYRRELAGAKLLTDQHFHNTGVPPAAARDAGGGRCGTGAAAGRAGAGSLMAPFCPASPTRVVGAEHVASSP